MALDAFINKFSGLTEAYKFYQNTIELRYEPRKHQYFLVTPNGLELQEGVTNVVHIIDKSEALIAWACKAMGQKLLAAVPQTTHDNPYTLERTAPEIGRMLYSDFENLVIAAKTAHKDKLDEASNVGHIAHDWIEQYIKALVSGMIVNSGVAWMIPPPDNEQAKNCCQAALTWMHRHNIRWIHTEKKVYSKKWKYAGTMDGLCMADSCLDVNCCQSLFRDALTLADWKTSNALYPEYLLQTAAYQAAYSEEYGVHITHRWVIRLGKEDGEFEPWHMSSYEDHHQDFKAFTDALSLTRSIAVVRSRLKDIEDEAKKLRKAAKKEATEKALIIKCKGADKYQGKRRPACNKGNPCQSCTNKYQELHQGES